MTAYLLFSAHPPLVGTPPRRTEAKLFILRAVLSPIFWGFVSKNLFNLLASFIRTNFSNAPPVYFLIIGKNEPPRAPSPSFFSGGGGYSFIDPNSSDSSPSFSVYFLSIGKNESLRTFSPSPLLGSGYSFFPIENDIFFQIYHKKDI